VSRDREVTTNSNAVYPSARILLRRFTRAKHSVLLPTSYESRFTNHAKLIGTPERLETRVNHRKQTIGIQSNRYRSRDACPVLPPSSRGRSFRSRWFALTKEALTRLPRAMARGAKYLISLSRHSSLGTRHWSRLPDTAKRVETYVSHRKQTIATCSTRHSSHHTARRPRPQSSRGDSRKSYRVMFPRTVARHSEDTDRRYEKR
jgi:hypothetical protein